MKAEMILESLRSQGAEVWLDGDRLRLRAPEALLTETMRATVAALKGDIVRLLSKPTAAPRSEVPPAESPKRPVNTRGYAEPEGLEHLRRLCPNLWTVVKVGERTGLLWGVHARGAVVSFDPKGPLYTLDAAEVEPLAKESEEEA